MSSKAFDEGAFERNPKIREGQPVFRGTRVLLRTVLGRLAKEETFEEIMKAYPELTQTQLRAAVLFSAYTAPSEYSPDAPWATDDARQWVLESDATLHTRVGFWIAAHTAGLVLVADVDEPSFVGKLFACGFGVLMTAVWGFSVHSIHVRIQRVTSKWAPRGFWGEWMGSEDDGPVGVFRRWFTGGKLVVCWTPWLFCFAWIGLGCWSMIEAAVAGGVCSIAGLLCSCR